MNGYGWIFLFGLVVGVWCGVTWEPKLSAIAAELYRVNHAPVTH